MTISFKGVTLQTTLSADVAAWIEANIPLDRCVPFEGQTWPGARRQRWAFAGWRGLDRIQVNRLLWPNGAGRCAVGWFLADAVALAAIGATGQSGTFILSDGFGNQISTTLWLLSAVPLTGCATPDRLWLLTFVDDRYWWRAQAATVTVTGGTTTWTGLYSAIAAALGVTITPDGIAAAYLKPDGELTGNDDDLAQQLDVTATNVGQRIQRKLDGTVQALSPTSAATLQAANLAAVAAANRFLLAGGDAKAPAVPASVNVAFRRANAYTLENVTDRTTLRYAVAKTAGDVGATGVTTVSGAKLFHDSAVARFTYATDGAAVTVPDNATELAALAAQIATDWYAWAAAAGEYVFGGIVPWVPGGFADCVEWTHCGGEMTTRVRRAPWNDLTEELLHYGSYAWPPYLTFRTATAWTPTVSAADCCESSLTLNVDTSTGLTFAVDTVAGTATVGFVGGAGSTTFSTMTFTSGATITANGQLTFTGGYVTVNNPWYFTGGVLFPETINVLTGGSHNNYATSDLHTIQDGSTSAATTFTGLTSPSLTTPDGFFQWWVNTGSANLTFNHQDGGSSANNRIVTPDGNPYVVPAGFAVPMKYDATLDRWRLLVLPASGPTTYNAAQAHNTGYTLTASFADVTSLAISVPAGNYEIWASGYYNWNPNANGNYLQARLYDGTAAVGNTDPEYVASSDMFNLTGGNDRGSFSLMSTYTAAGTVTISLQALYNAAGGGTTATILNANLFILKTG